MAAVTGSIERVGRRAVDAEESRTASRQWWDAAADDYQSEHGDFLGPAQFRWGPEGLDEERAGALGPLPGRRVLEVGCGAAQCSRWLCPEERRGRRRRPVRSTAPARPAARRPDAGPGSRSPRPTHSRCRSSTRASTWRSPRTAPCQFVADVASLMCRGGPGGASRRALGLLGDPSRALGIPRRPGAGRPDRASTRTSTGAPTSSRTTTGRATYVEQHRTLGDLVRALANAGWHLLDLLEPEWPDELDQVWGGWSPQRGRLLPGTAVFVSRREP